VKISDFMIRRITGVTNKLSDRATRRNQARIAYRNSKKDHKSVKAAA
jgi:hypothetical protein